MGASRDGRGPGARARGGAPGRGAEIAARPRRRPAPIEERRLSVAEAQFYARVFASARKGSLAELRRRGCTEQEAEELFAAAYARVMETVDPIARRFSAPQMVSFVKRACWRRLVDERRRRARRGELQARAPAARPEGGAEPPGELAEEREAVAIGREALAMLPERERLIFCQRHQQCLTPEEILQRTPGLSMRSYRKLIQRANARVLEAFARIEAGERCAEIGGPVLRRYLAGEGPPAERRAVEAHLAHCRTCQRAGARMRGYLIDVAAGALLASSPGGGSAVAGGLPARLIELTSHATQALGEASRGARERLREALLKLPGLPGADAGAAPALGATSVRIASACTAGIAAGACVAAGVVPGIAGVGTAGHHRARPAPAARSARAPGSPRRAVASEAASPSQSSAGSGRASPSAPARGTATAKRKSKASSAAGIEPSASRRSPSSARVSGRQTGAEFGAESSQPAPSSSSPAPSSSSSQGSSASSGAAAGGGSTGGSKAASGSSAEFGM